MVVLITIYQGATCPDNKDGAGVVYIYHGGAYPLIDEGLLISHLRHWTWMTSLVLQRQLKQSVAEPCQGSCEVLVPTSRHLSISMITDTSMYFFAIKTMKKLRKSKCIFEYQTSFYIWSVYLLAVKSKKI